MWQQTQRLPWCTARHQGLPATTRNRRGRILPRVSEEHGPADTVTSFSNCRNGEKTHLSCFKAPAWGPYHSSLRTHIHSSLLFSRSAQQASINVNRCKFSSWRNSVIHYCFIHTSMSGTIRSDCPYAAIFHTGTKCNGILVGRFSLYCHTTNTPLLMLWANIIK